jgi:hypothetical protein
MFQRLSLYKCCIMEHSQALESMLLSPLTLLIAQEGFIMCCHCEIFESCT